MSTPGIARRMGRWLIRLVSSILLLLVCLLTALFAFEEHTLQPLLQNGVKSTTGRDLVINGTIDLRLGRRIGFYASKLRLANAEWGSRADMLQLETIDFSLDWPRLFDGELHIDDLVIDGVDLLLETSADGDSNWTLPTTVEKSESEATGRTPLLLPRIQGRLSLVDFTFTDPKLLQPLRASLETIEIDSITEDAFRLGFDGSVLGKPIEANLKLAPIEGVLSASPVQLDVTGAIDEGRIDLTARTDDLLAPRNTTARARLAIIDLSQLGLLFQLPPSVRGAATVELDLSPLADIHRLRLSADSSVIDVDAEAILPVLTRPDGSLQLNATGPDLAVIGQLAGIEGLPDTAFQLTSSLEKSGTELEISKTRLQSGSNQITLGGSMGAFPRLTGANLSLRLTGDNYLDFAELLRLGNIEQLQPDPYRIDAELNYLSPTAQPFSATLSFGDLTAELNGQFSGDPRSPGTQVTYQIEAESDRLLAPIIGQQLPVEGPYQLQGELSRIAAGYRVEATELTLGENRLTATGVISDRPLQADSDLVLQYRGADLARLLTLVGYQGFVPEGQAEIQLEAGTESNRLRIDSMLATIGNNRLRGTGLVNLLQQGNNSRASLTLEAEDAFAVLPADYHAYLIAGQALRLETDLSFVDKQLDFSSLRLSLGANRLEASGTVSTQSPLNQTAASVSLSGPDLSRVVAADLPPYPLPQDEFEIATRLTLNGTTLEISSADLRIAEERIALSASIPIFSPLEGLQARIEASGSDLSRLVPLENQGPDIFGLDYSIAAELTLAEGIASISDMDFTSPLAKLAGSFAVSIEQPRDYGKFDLKASGTDFAQFIPEVAGYKPPDSSYHILAQGEWDRDRVSVENGKFRFDDSRIEIAGSINLPPNPRQSRLSIRAEGPSLDDFGSYEGVQMPSGAFRLQADLQNDALGIAVPDFKLEIGESDLSGTFAFDVEDKPDIVATLHSELIDFPTLFRQTEQPGEEPPPEPAPSDGRVIPELAMPIEQLHRLNLKSNITLNEVRSLRQTLRDLRFDAVLKDGDLKVEQVTASAREGTFSARFQAVAENDRIVTTGQIEGRDIILGKSTGDDEATRRLPEMDLRMEFDTAGANLRELGANLNGYAWVDGQEGWVRNSRALGLYGGFFTELISTINPFLTREPFTRIDCFATYTEFSDGVGQIHPGTVLRTDKLDIFARGKIDLDDEGINLRFDTTSRKGIGISTADFVNPFVGVSGTLAQPGLGVNPQSAMFEGGFAVATGGLSIVAKSLYNRWFGAEDPCGRMDQAAQESAALLRERRAQAEREAAGIEADTPTE